MLGLGKAQEYVAFSMEAIGIRAGCTVCLWYKLIFVFVVCFF